MKNRGTPQLNNKGFSLVELLVAVSILALVTVPLLHSFVTASSTTAKSRKLGDATLASQNIAEAIEANSLGTILSMPASTLGANAGANYSYNGSAYTQIPTYDAKDDVYYVGVTNIKAGANTFNAMVKFDGAADEFADANNKLISEYSNIDAIFAQSRAASDDPDNVSYDNFITHATQMYGNIDPIYSKRTIDLLVETKTDGDTRLYATLTFNYEYRFSYTETVVDLETGLTEDVNRTTIWDDDNPPTYLLFPQGYLIENDKMPSIYLLYYPMYGAQQDTINIRNNEELGFKLFLSKQVDPNLTESELGTKETGYRAVITQFQIDGSADGAAFIYSNARQNLRDGSNIPTVSYRIRGGLLGSSSKFEGETEGDLVAKTAKNRLYKVTILIFDSTSSYDEAPIYTFETTKLQ